MFSPRQMFRDLVAQEGITVRYKNEHWWWRILGENLCENFVTTLGETVYVPSRAWVDRDPQRAWKVLCHELVHVEDYRQCRPSFVFCILYAFPHWLALLAILSPIIWSWWPLAFLVFLAPWPSPWRHLFEMRAYAMTMAVEYWYNGRGIPQALKEAILIQFTGPSYFFMYPFKPVITREIGRWSKRILCEETDAAGDVFRRVRLMIKEHR